MKKFHSNSIKALAFSASAIAFVIAGPAYAQDADEQPAEEEEQVDVTEGEAAKAEDKIGNITVTGSRIVRDTYSSISPLQVLTTENQQAVPSILRRSSSARKRLPVSRSMRPSTASCSTTARVRKR